MSDDLLVPVPPTDGSPSPAAAGVFADLLAANDRFRDSFAWGDISPRPARQVALVMCMDSRIDPLATLGLGPGDAKIMRNAGGRVTNDVLRSLVLATSLLGVTRIAVIQHTDCAMTKAGEDDLRRAVQEHTGADASGWDFHSIPDQAETLRADLQRIRDCDVINDDVIVGGFVYDVHTGALRPVA